jgi:hypothetical protein
MSSSGARSAASATPDGERRGPLPVTLTLLAVLLLALFFAQTEIQIEGPAGWALALPTWRIEHHWLLDLFWGGRPMTGYHAWVFPFIALCFHFPFVLLHQWSPRTEARAVGCILLFWVAEDFLWFVLNPAFGLARFAAPFIVWHKHWLWLAPTDYWVGLAAAGLLLRYSWNKP